jgi:periplasmic protein TonB
MRSEATMIRPNALRRSLPAAGNDDAGAMVRRRLAQAPRELQAVHLVGVALGISVLMVVGVHWLRQLSAIPAAPTQCSVVEVHLVPLPSPERKPQETPLRQEMPSLEPRPAPPVVRPERPTDKKPDMTRLVAIAPAVALETPPARIARTPDAPPLRTAAPGVASEFQKILLAHIERYRQYPDAARQRHLKGVVQVLFSMSRSGAVLGVWVKTSSGEAILDREAMDTVRRAQPLPMIPAALPDPLDILLPVAFEMP